MLERLTYKKVFLIDAIGALITTILLSQVVARFEEVFGMPREIVIILAAMAACLSAYSFSCYWMVKQKPKPFLLAIAVANSLYCMLTFGLIVYLFDTLPWIGITYLLGEIIIVMGLVQLELRFARKIGNKT